MLCDVVVLVLLEGEFFGKGHVLFDKFDVFLCQKFDLLVEELVDPLVLGQFLGPGCVFVLGLEFDLAQFHLDGPNLLANVLALGVLLLHLVLESVDFRFELLLNKCQLLYFLLFLFVLPNQGQDSVLLFSAQVFEFTHLYCLLVKQPLFLLEGTFYCFPFLLQLSYLPF